jgi:hypothetical protein
MKALGFDKQVTNQVIQEVHRWIRSNGPEWTVSRLKLLKSQFIEILSTGKLSDKSWIAYRGKLPKGSFRPIFRYGLDNHNSPKKVQRALSVLMIYTSMLSSKETRKQKEKFFNSMEKSEPSFSSIFKDLKSPFKQMRPFKLKNIVVKRSKSVPYLNTVFEGMYDDEDPLKVLKTQKGGTLKVLETFSHPLVYDYNEKYPEIIDSNQQISLAVLAGTLNPSVDDDFDYVGKISFIQEPGYKLRAIANPLPCFQTLLRGSKDWLTYSLSKLKEDSTMDQNKGMDRIMHMMSKIPKWSSLDLSDATNTLPFSEQKTCSDTYNSQKTRFG